MSEKGSVYQKGGGGTNFEQFVQCAFLTTLIVQGTTPLIPNGKLVEVAFQTTSRGYETDDLLAIIRSDIGTHRLLAQIKHNLTFTDSDTNTTFKEVIKGFWIDFNNASIFDKDKDKLLIIKSGLNNQERNHIKPIFNWAKNHNNAEVFFAEVNRIQKKKEYLDIFRSVLIQANEGNPITDEEFWHFIKCLYLLEYDFQHEGSIDETYFINLIKLSKSNHSTASETDIWNSIYTTVAKYNPDGGSITIDNLKELDVYKHFDIDRLSPIADSFKKLQKDSDAILSPFKNTINGLHLDRLGLLTDIIEAINNHSFSIITGNAGVGKSAILKDVLNTSYLNSSLFVFRADQFNEPHLAHVFSKNGINESIEDILSYIALNQEKFIIIDSLEKLLEGDPENAFKQLLELIKKYPDIKIIATSRSYAIDLIFQKYNIQSSQVNKIEIPDLSDTDLNIILDGFPHLKLLETNIKLKRFLRVPKYIDFITLSPDIVSENYADLTVIDLKNKLWSNIIENTTVKKNGIDKKRNDAFLHIAIQRAKKMQLFVEPVSGFEEAIELLEKDNIIFKDGTNYKFAPTHDILEDWALIKYIEAKYDEFGASDEFFQNLGTEPAIRRAFRLWVEECLLDNDSKINKLVNLTLDNRFTDRYWADELLIAMFKSESCHSFIETFTDELLEDGGAFFNRCMHLMRTACKESNSSDVLLPAGIGWKEFLIFIEDNINDLDKFRLSILNLISDWQLSYILKRDNELEECFAVGSIAQHFIRQIESLDEFWLENDNRKKVESIIFILFNQSQVLHEEVANLIERSLAYLNNEDDNKSLGRLHFFYNEVIKKCLSGTESFILAEELPDLIFKVAREKWKSKVSPTDIGDSLLYEDLSPFNKSSWGIIDEGDFFPAGIYKTPIYNLLRTKPLKTFDFIIELMNFSIDYYLGVNGYSSLKQIEIELNDGTVVKQWGSAELWLAYRGTSTTHDLLISILMSLEKYLLEEAESKTNISRENLEYIYNKLLKNSNNVSVTSVLVSVAMAYPNEVGKAMLPLLSCLDFYSWDLTRNIHETTTFSPKDYKISFAQLERHKSNQLPHRAKFYGGLRAFIVDHQFNIGTLNKEIHQIIDNLKDKLCQDDIYTNKLLTEIDIRNWEIGDYDEKLGGHLVQAKYDNKVAKHIESGKNISDEQEDSASKALLIKEFLEGKREIEFILWEEIYQYYIDKKEFHITFDRPIGLAILGLRLFNKQLNDQQKEWIIKIMNQAYNELLTQGSTNYNIMDENIVLESFDLLYNELDDTGKKLVQETIVKLLCSLPKYKLDIFIPYLRNAFGTQHPQCLREVWFSLIKNSEHHQFSLKQRFQGKKGQEEDFLSNILRENDNSLIVEEINFNHCSSRILLLALSITPYNTEKVEYNSFLKRMLILIGEDLTQKIKYNREREVDYESRHHIEFYLSDLFLNGKTAFSIEILDILLPQLLNSDPKESYRGEEDYLDFIKASLDYTMCILYDNGNIQPEPPNYSLQENNFWKLWEYMYKMVKQSEVKCLVDKLLLHNRFLMFDSAGKLYEKSWKALKGQFGFYSKVVNNLGKSHVRTIIDVFSTFARKDFLPEGISLIRSIIENNPSELLSLSSNSSERLIKELYQHHIQKIKSDKGLIDDYLWILNQMVDLGSSEAYRYRENFITYKIHK